MRKQHRLRKSADFARLRREGRTYRHPYLTLSLAPNDLAYNRYGYITAKYLGNAVARNRVRRLLKEAVRLLHPRLQPGYDVIVIARPQSVGQPFAMVEQALKQVFKRARLLANED